MKEYGIGQIRNIALVGQGNSGKTTLAEAMALCMGIVNRMGTVDAGNTLSDFTPDESERKISISAAMLNGDWSGTKINIIDVPGYSDFLGECRGALRAADTAVLVMDALSGVEVGIEQGWRTADERKLPAIFVVNKLDKEQSDFNQTVAALQEQYGRGVAAVQFPVGHGQAEFNTVVDLILMKQLSFSTDGSGKVEEKEIPEDQKATADSLREKLMEAVAESDDELLEAYLDKGELTEEQFASGFCTAVSKRGLFPVFCSAAEGNIGTRRLLDAVCRYLPAPDWAKEVVGARPHKDEQVVRQIESAGTPLAFVFKTIAEAHVGELSFFKVYAGSVASGADLLNATTGNTERIGQLFFTNGKNRTETGQVTAGDIGAAVKLKATHTGDTLCDKSDPIKLPAVDFPKPSIHVAIVPKARSDEEKISDGLSRLREEDPSFTITHDSEMSQMIISGQGELHLALIVKRLKDKFGVEVDTKEPRIPYRETIKSKTRVMYRHKKQTGGAGQFGEVHFFIQPYNAERPPAVPSEFTVRGEELEELPWGGKLSFINCIVGGAIDARFIPAVKKGILEMMHGGVVAGYPVRDVQVILHDGKMHSVDSNENAFKTAGRMAFRNGVLEAKPVMFEPIADVEVHVPEEFMGDVMGDLSSRRGKILGMESEGKFQKVKARVPLAEMHRYSTKLRSMTSGRGFHEMTVSNYEELPRELADKLIEEAKKEKEEA